MGQIVKLSDLFRIGSSKRVLKAQWKKSGVPFYRGREITKLSQDGAVSNELFITEELYEEYAEKYGVPEAGDIVITAIGTIGNSYIVSQGDRFYFKDASVLWLKRTSDVCSEYINLWLKSPLMRDQLDEGNGATVDTLTIKKLQSLIVDLPPIPEQKRIVAILDQAFADIDKARALTEQNLKNARELFESYLQKVSGSKKALRDFVSIKTGKLNANAAVEGGQYPFFTCSREIFEIDKYSFDCEAILLAGNNASGDFNVKHYKGKFDAYQRTYVISINDETRLLYPFLLYQMLKSLKELKKTSVGAATKFLKLDMIKNLMISVPDINEQKEVLSTLSVLKEQTDQLFIQYQAKLERLDELKKSLLQKAFTGELTSALPKNKDVA
jgi:type I restriction enzyme S subunit